MDKLWQALMMVACDAVETGDDEGADRFLALAGQVSEMTHEAMREHDRS